MIEHWRPPAWLEKPLDSLTEVEWEALCDGCGRCCLNKLEDEETGDLFYTRVACPLLDLSSCRCRHYPQRSKEVPECLDLREDPSSFRWLPTTCAYRLRAEGKPLPDWHPLISGISASVHLAGISVRHFAVTQKGDEDLEDFLLDAPL